MKFRKVIFYNHPVLGSISFDFTDAEGKTVNTIILAGENGCGKSLLLSVLNNYNPGFTAKELGYRLKVEVELSGEDIEAIKSNKNTNNVIGNLLSGNIVTFVHDTTFQDDLSRVMFSDENGRTQLKYAHPFSSIPTLYKTVFSDVEINFSI